MIASRRSPIAALLSVILALSPAAASAQNALRAAVNASGVRGVATGPGAKLAISASSLGRLAPAATEDGRSETPESAPTPATPAPSAADADSSAPAPSAVPSGAAASSDLVVSASESAQPAASAASPAAAAPAVSPLRGALERAGLSEAFPASGLAARDYGAWLGGIFDRSKAKSGAERFVAALPSGVRETLRGRLEGSVGRALVAPADRARLSRALEASKVERAPFDTDQYGGPNPAKLGLKARLAVGARYGLLMTGAAALINLAAGALWMLPWQELPGGAVESMGRVALLVDWAPTAIAEALANGPLSFLMVSLPAAAVAEEFSYRGVQFLLYFAGALGVSKLAARASRLLASAPDIGFVRSMFEGLANTVARLKPFRAAAVMTALNFALAHQTMWGWDPTFLAVQFVAGLLLARVAYRTRSLTAPVAAHFLFNLLVLAPLALGPLGVPAAAAITFGSAGYLLYRLARRSALAAKAAREVKS